MKVKELVDIETLDKLLKSADRVEIKIEEED